MGKLAIRPELYNDICGLQEQVTSKSAMNDKFQVVDTDDWEDLLLAGTEVIGSCQSVNGNPKLNKCLLDYVMNGRNRMIAIKDPSGKIIARRIFRLLWDERQRRPVLFMERTYSNYIDPKIDRILINYAKERAEALGLPLLSSVDEGRSYPNDIRGLPGPCPWGYCDSALRGEFAGVYEHAEFTIAKPRIIDAK